MKNALEVLVALVLAVLCVAMYHFIFGHLDLVMWTAIGSWGAALVTWVVLRVLRWRERRRKEREVRERIPRAVVL